MFIYPSSGARSRNKAFKLAPQSRANLSSYGGRLKKVPQEYHKLALPSVPSRLSVEIWRCTKVGTEPARDLLSNYLGKCIRLDG